MQPNIETEIEDGKRFLDRAHRFLEKVEEVEATTTCEICYEGKKQCSYLCDRHKVCKICYMKILLCPFCRASKKGDYPGMWVFNPESAVNSWVLLSDDAIQNGINSTFFYDPPRMLTQFQVAMRFAWEGVRSLDHDIDRLGFPTQSSREGGKFLLRTIADGVNRKVNYPIFAFKDKHDISYCSDRWKVIEQSLAERACQSPAEHPEFKRELRQALGPLLIRIRKVAPKVGFKWVQA